MPAPADQQGEAARERATLERAALSPGLPAAALSLMARQSPTVLRAVTEQASTVPDEPAHMTQLKAVSALAVCDSYLALGGVRASRRRCCARSWSRVLAATTVADELAHGRSSRR